MSAHEKLPHDRSAGTRSFINARSVAVPALLILIYACARLWRLAGECLWFDEIFGIHAASHSWDRLWSFVAADLIHPPLFYALLKLWIAAGGESILWLELFAYATSLLCLIPLLLLARELRLGQAAINLALLLFAVSGYLIKYAQEVRMYALLLFFALASLWLFARMLNAARATKGLYAALALVNILLVYTHYYGWLVVCGEVVYLSLSSRGRRRLSFFSMTVGVAALCFAPWVWAVISAAGVGGGLAENVGWIARPTIADAPGFYALLSEPFYFRQSSADPVIGRAGVWLGALLVGLPVMLVALRSLGARLSSGSTVEDSTAEDKPNESAPVPNESTHVPRASDVSSDARAARFLFFFSLFPVVVSFVASYALPHAVWGTRHLIVTAGPYLLLAGLGVARLKPRWLRATVIIGLSVWFTAAGVMALARPSVNYVWCAWGHLAGQTFREDAKAARATDIYAFEDLAAYQLWHELRGSQTRFRLHVVKGVEGLIEDPSYFIPRRFDEVTKTDVSAFRDERFWITFRATEVDEKSPPLNLLAERGYRIIRRHETTAQGQRVLLLLVSRERAGED